MIDKTLENEEGVNRLAHPLDDKSLEPQIIFVEDLW